MKKTIYLIKKDKIENSIERLQEISGEEFYRLVNAMPRKKRYFRTQRKLFVNTRNSKREFFYSCRNCKESGGLDYLAAHEVIVNQINKEDEV